MTLAPSGSAYPISLEAQLAWHAAQFQAPPPHPAPLVVARSATAQEISRAPRTVASMRSLAWKCGWRANVTYAHGTTMTAQGKAGRLVESLALRLRYACKESRDALGAVAVWETNTRGGWTLDMAWFWPVTGEAFPQRLGADEMRHLITEASVIVSKPSAWRWMAAIDVVARFRAIKAEAKTTRAAAKAVEIIPEELAGQVALPLAA
jgi:hypothetical protein